MIWLSGINNDMSSIDIPKRMHRLWTDVQGNSGENKRLTELHLNYSTVCVHTHAYRTSMFITSLCREVTNPQHSKPTTWWVCSEKSMSWVSRSRTPVNVHSCVRANSRTNKTRNLNCCTMPSLLSLWRLLSGCRWCLHWCTSFLLVYTARYASVWCNTQSKWDCYSVCTCQWHPEEFSMAESASEWIVQS